MLSEHSNLSRFLSSEHLDLSIFGHLSQPPPHNKNMLSPFFLLKSPALKKRKKIQSSFRALFCCINLKVAIFCKIVYLQKCVNAPLPYFVFFYKVQRNALFCCTFLIIKFRLMLMMFIKKNTFFFVSCLV